MDETVLSGKRILLGVSGSIAAYKAATLASQLTQAGASVDTILTEAATRFIAPLAFEALTGRPAYTSMWATEQGGTGTHISHVRLAHQADLMIVAPATAHTLARLATGLADDLLSVTALAAQCPILVAPAMDAGMYEAAATQANVATLRERGVIVAGPAPGRMASGLVGLGRMIEPEEILGHARRVLGRSGPMAGKRVVVTAGPTREAIDPVRFLSNRATGRQGFALAQAAIDAGAQVVLISGPSELPTPVGAERVDVTDAREMEAAVLAHACGEQLADALIMSAAVADFRPAEAQAEKIKKSDDGLPELRLARNPDILLSVSRQVCQPRVTIGFAAETRDLIANAQDKLERKNLDLIVANDISRPDAGFAVETNVVHFITGEGVEDLPPLSKAAVAARIVAWLAERLQGNPA